MRQCNFCNRELVRNYSGDHRDWDVYDHYDADDVVIGKCIYVCDRCRHTNNFSGTLELSYA